MQSAGSAYEINQLVDFRLTGGAASVVSRFSRAPQIHLPNLPTEMENIITDDQNWYSKQPSQH